MKRTRKGSFIGRGGAAASAALWVIASGPATADDAKQVVATVCSACHGEDGNSVAPAFPRLAGQTAPYLAKQLNDLLTGKRKSEAMAAVLEKVKAGDVATFAAHYSAQKPARGSATDAALAAAGEKLYKQGNEASGVPACAGCHLPNGLGDAENPRLAGQHRDYTIAELTGFKSGARANDRRRAMRGVAERMTEAEIKAVAEYMAGL
jgi:cytochrome c553